MDSSTHEIPGVFFFLDKHSLLVGGAIYLQVETDFYFWVRVLPCSTYLHTAKRKQSRSGGKPLKKYLEP